MKRIIHKQLKRLGVPLCDGFCGPCFRIGKKQRQNTQYNNEEDNWVFLCDNCMKENDAHWEERWDEFYRGCL